MGAPASGVRGTLEIAGDQPVEVLALRGTYNYRGEFLFTSLPVADYAATPAQSLIFAHFADGGGYATQTAVLNVSDNPGSLTQRFFSSKGSALAVDQK